MISYLIFEYKDLLKANERNDEKYRKALEKGAAVLGGVENAAFQMKKLGNDIGLYNQFVNAFSQEKVNMAMSLMIF